MNSIFQKTGLALAMVSALGACQMKQGGPLEKPKPMMYIMDPEGCVIGAGTVGTSMDASFTFAGRYCRHPQTGGWALMKGDGTFSPTLAGQALQAFIAGPLTAATQGVGGYKIAQEAKCDDCGDTTVFNNRSESLAVSDARNKGSNDVTVKTTGW